jgi:hypothetical protein
MKVIIYEAVSIKYYDCVFILSIYKLCIFIVIFIYSYCNVYSYCYLCYVLCILSHCVALCIVLCVNVYCTTATGAQLNCSQQIYHHIIFLP